MNTKTPQINSDMPSETLNARIWIGSEEENHTCM